MAVRFTYALAHARNRILRRISALGEMKRPFPDIGIIALVPENWDPSWSTRRQFLTRLSAYFQVVWCNPPVSWRDPVPSLSTEDPGRQGMMIYHPGRWRPKMYWPAPLAYLTERLRIAGAARMLRRAGCKKIVLYVWRPEFADSLKISPHDLSVYHIDDEYSFSTVDLPQDPAEAALIRAVDRVIIHSPALMEKKGSINPHTRWIPNGVDFNMFSRKASSPPELAGISRPIMGYTGTIKKQLDIHLLYEVFKARPDWSLVLVGRVEEIRGKEKELRALLALPNVHSLGPKPIEAIPSLVQACDVCLLPYVVDGYTKYIYPLKLHEYLAAGRPVVGTPIRTLMDFQHWIKLAAGSESWIQALEQSLPLKTDALAKARQAEAKRYDWDILTHQIAECICEGLGSVYLDRLLGNAADSYPMSSSDRSRITGSPRDPEVTVTWMGRQHTVQS